VSWPAAPARDAAALIARPVGPLQPDGGPPIKLAVAALSARLLAEAAEREGFAVLALDLFGDVDARRASLGWQSIAGARRWHIDEQHLLQGLRQAARLGAQGWLAGSGFEAQPALLDAGHRVLPLLGMAGAALRRLRDPQVFFSFLAAQGLPHPATQLQPPASAEGWLIKNSRACGGGHVRPARADEPALPAHHLAQRWSPGQPMSATFVADGRSAEVLGFNRLLVSGWGASPYQFVGATGPLALPPPAEQLLRQALQLLVPEFGLVGLGSLDFLLHGAQVQLLEVNARPPATVALHGVHRPISAHLAACGGAGLPSARSAGRSGQAAARPGGSAPPVQGFATVFAERAQQVGPALAAALAALPNHHDLPHTGDLFEPGSPVCSVSAQAADEPAVQHLLAERRARIHQLLETTAP